MNYRHIYMLIIEHAKSEEKLGIRAKGNGNYYEKHHILPKSLFPLWKNRKSNVVLLTAREHFFCHQLLTKIYPSKEMNYALVAFVIRPNSDYKISSREYEKIKKSNSELMKNKMKGKKKNPNSVKKSAETRTGTKRTEEVRKNLSEIQKELWKKGVYKNKKKIYGHWYTNGVINIYLKEDEKIPENFKKGRTVLWNWYTNGIVNIQIKEGEKIPENFKKGRKIPENFKRGRKIESKNK